MFGIAIIGLVYVLVLSLGGIDGKLFQPMAQAVILAVAGLAWTFMIFPTLAAWLLRAPDNREDSRNRGLIDLAEHAYCPPRWSPRSGSSPWR